MYITAPRFLLPVCFATRKTQYPHMRTCITTFTMMGPRYDGIIITDSMQMGAITDHYDSAQAALKALDAGCDMILMPQDFPAAYEGVLAAVRDGRISQERLEESLERILRVKYRLLSSESFRKPFVLSLAILGLVR